MAFKSLLSVILFAAAAAVMAFPIGWILAGVIQAAARYDMPALFNRQLYAPGNHCLEAAAASGIAALAVFLFRIGQRLNARD